MFCDPKDADERRPALVLVDNYFNWKTNWYFQAGDNVALSVKQHYFSLDKMMLEYESSSWELEIDTLEYIHFSYSIYISIELDTIFI